MKRIAYILTTYPCASETFIRNEIALLRAKGLDILIFAACSDSRGERLSDVDVVYRPKMMSLRSIAAVLRCLLLCPVGCVKMFAGICQFFAVCPKEGMSLIRNVSAICYFASHVIKHKISHIHGAFMNWPGRMGWILAKMTGVPYSLAVHARDGYVEGGAMTLKIRKATFVLCCSRAMTDYMRSIADGCDRHKMYTVYHGAAMKPVYNRPDVRSREAVIVAIGRFVQKKGFNVLLSAFKEMLQDCDNNAVLVLIGDGPECDYLKNQAAAYKIQNRVFFTGWLNHQQTLSTLARSYLLAVPSITAADHDSDGIPNVILEAFMLNVPVVASAIKSIREVIEHGENGLLCEPGDSYQLKKNMLHLLGNRQLRETMTAKASRYGAKYFDATENVDKVYTLFNAAHS